MTTPAFSANGGTAGQVRSVPSQSAPRSSSGGMGVFTRKMGPLPLWAWMALMLGIAAAYYIFKKHTSGAATNDTTTATGAPDQTTAASQIPQFVNETNVTSAPSTPATPPATPAPSSPAPIQGVPDVVGMSRATAEATLKNAGVEFQYDLAKGQKLAPKTGYTITVQNPPSGAQVQPGQKIQLHVETTQAYKKAGNKQVP